MFMEEILKDVDVSLSWRQISELKRGSTALPSNRVPWKLISFPCLDSFSTTNTQQDWVFPCWLAFFFSSCKAHPPASRSFASERQLCLPVPVCKSRPGQSQPGGSSPASHDHLDSSAFSSHHLSSLSLHVPSLKSASSIYHFRIGGKKNDDQCQSQSTYSFLPFPTRVIRQTEPGSGLDVTIRLEEKLWKAAEPQAATKISSYFCSEKGTAGVLMFRCDLA